MVAPGKACGALAVGTTFRNLQYKKEKKNPVLERRAAGGGHLQLAAFALPGGGVYRNWLPGRPIRNFHGFLSSL
jgi:hypothetical protein